MHECDIVALLADTILRPDDEVKHILDSSPTRFADAYSRLLYTNGLGLPLWLPSTRPKIGDLGEFRSGKFQAFSPNHNILQPDQPWSCPLNGSIEEEDYPHSANNAIRCSGDVKRGRVDVSLDE